jgi:DNA-binding transcriptional LysR family regulator
MLDWNDLRYFIAVACEGSTLAAGRLLGVSQTTVARRIAALESSLGFPLFDKRQAGYVLTPAGEELVDDAKRVEQAASSFSDSAQAHARDLSGMVRITTEEIYATGLIAPFLRELHQLHPEIVIEVDTGSELRDLAAGEADIALRSSASDQGAGIVGRRLCVDDWTLYCSREYAEREGTPDSIEKLKRHPIVGGGGAKLWQQYKPYLESLGLEGQVAMHHATSTGLLTAIRSGFGVAVLPCVVADADPELVRCIKPRGEHGRILWLLTHERLRRTPRVRAVIDFLYDRLRRHVQKLNSDELAA